jgi:hypothetical protein
MSTNFHELIYLSECPFLEPLPQFVVIRVISWLTDFL